MFDDKGSDPAGMRDPLGMRVTTLFNDTPAGYARQKNGAVRQWFWAIGVLVFVYLIFK